jgi:hypothetical protein
MSQTPYLFGEPHGIFNKRNQVPVMTLRDAAKLLDKLIIEPAEPLTVEIKTALSLGAQALRRIDFERSRNYPTANKLLPTEICGPKWEEGLAGAEFDAIPSHREL